MKAHLWMCFFYIYIQMRPLKIIRSDVRADKIINFRVYNKKLYETENCVGRCWPHEHKHIIEIDPRQYPKDYMDTLIHECLHELFPNKSEKVILRAATSITNVLWRLGYRRKST